MKRLLLAALLVATVACAGHASPKVTIDVADRTAYGALRILDIAEEGAYHAKGAWPTPAQHQAISVKFSQAYQAVVDTANLGIALPPGSKLTPADLAIIGKLTTTVADLATLVGAPGVSATIVIDFNKFQTQAAALVAAIGK